MLPKCVSSLGSLCYQGWVISRQEQNFIKAGEKTRKILGCVRIKCPGGEGLRYPLLPQGCTDFQRGVAVHRALENVRESAKDGYLCGKVAFIGRDPSGRI